MADERVRINDLPADASPSPDDNVAIDRASTRRTTVRQLVAAALPIATEPQARQGLNDAVAMTPLKTAQAIETLGSSRFASIAQGNLAATAVQPNRTIATGTGLSGGGDLSQDRTVSLSAESIASLARADSAVQSDRTVSAGSGLVGGGTLAANITLSLSSTALATLALADTAVQPADLGALARKDKVATTDIDATGSTSNGALLTRGGNWVVPSGGGDMFRLTYDPKNKLTDAFDMANMDEAANAKIMTAAERAKLTGIETGAQVNTVRTVAGKTGDVVVNKADVGLGNVANKTEAQMAATGAIADAIGGKLNLSGGQMTGTINGAAATAAGLSSFFANTHGGSFDGMRTRGAPFTSWVNHSGSSYAPVVKISYNSANAYVGHWSVGVLNGQDANANTFCISHVNADGHLGRSWFFNPISGDLEIPAALKMTRGAFYDDGNSGGAKWEAWGSWYAFEAINNRIEQRARDWAVQEGNWQTRTYLLAERFPIGSTLLARVNHADLPSGTWVGGDQIEMVYFSDGNGTPMRMNSSNGPGWGSWEALSHISRYHAGNFKRVQ
ncbi:hypothetical protein [Ochrobactrum sp. SFR4]|uniref:hypothetical protein n=1 Tax=Ochrobactrum sp. SFR4 TaxID=2717368 RepID=UPI001C8C14DC|nr:hypothetical protein [Ochrobactrum sp. SFR4]MBX8825238.1 hypothetical protein [Ochrobactrum sp. SFR4]